MQVTHPRALEGDLPQIAVDVNGEHVTLDEHGRFDVDDEQWVRDFARAHGVAVEDITEAETCDVVMSNGEVCGRDLPCQYHSEEA